MLSNKLSLLEIEIILMLTGLRAGEKSKREATMTPLVLDIMIWAVSSLVHLALIEVESGVRPTVLVVQGLHPYRGRHLYIDLYCYK